MKYMFGAALLMSIVLPMNGQAQTEDSVIEFRIAYDTQCDGCDKTEHLNAATGKLETLYLGAIELSDAHVEEIGIQDVSGENAFTIKLHFTEKGKEILSRITGANIKRRLAILVKGEVVTAPIIYEPIGGGVASITGAWTKDDAEQIRAQLQENIKR